MFFLEFAKYAIAVQFVYRWLVICRLRKIFFFKFSYNLHQELSIIHFQIYNFNLRACLNGTHKHYHLKYWIGWKMRSPLSQLST
jgi:hypothetical protein